MPNRLGVGGARLAERMAAHNSVSVAVEWKNQTATLSAVRAKQMMRVGDDFGHSRIEYTDRDYIIRKTDLAEAFNDWTEPVPGMRFTDEGLVFEAARFNGEQCFQQTPQGHQYRIHCKQVE